MTNILDMTDEEFEKLPFWQKDYAKLIGMMTWKELLDETLSNRCEPFSYNEWQSQKAEALLTTRIEEMEDELNAFHELHKLKEDEEVAIGVAIKS